MPLYGPIRRRGANATVGRLRFRPPGGALTGACSMRMVTCAFLRMKAMGLKRIAGVVAVFLAAACTAPVQGPYIPLTRLTPATPTRPLIAENRVDPYDGVIPACADPNVLQFIKDRFATREAGYWDSSIEISGFEAPYEIASRPRGPTFVPRRYCSVTGLFSDNRPRKIFYSVDEDMSLFSLSWNVTWCPVGLDRNLTYAPGCKMARP